MVNTDTKKTNIGREVWRRSTSSTERSSDLKNEGRARNRWAEGKIREDFVRTHERGCAEQLPDDASHHKIIIMTTRKEGGWSGRPFSFGETGEGGVVGGEVPW